MRKDEFLHFVLIPLIIGILGGFSAVLFRWFIKYFEHLYQKMDVFHSNLSYLFTMPLVFWFSYYLISKLLINTSNVTLDNIAKKISIMAGNFSILKGFLVLFLTSFNIGFGAPVGREAPIAKLGGLLGEVFLKIVHVPKVNIPIYLGAAVSSAIAATFNAPLAGIILGIEIIIGKINTYIIIPMIVSCATATMFAREFLGDYTAFFVPHLEFREIYFYIVPILGVVFAILSIVMFYFFDFFRELRVVFRHKWNKIVLFNGFVVGVLIYVVPESMGVGYEYITALFKGDFGIHQALIIMTVKFIAVVITIGSGLFGGLMSPSIFIGSFGGYFIGGLFVHFGVDPKVLALVGSVAMLSGISRAPLRSSIIIIELTHSYQMLIPSLIVGSITAFIVAKFEPGGYFKRSLIQKGIDIENPKVVKFLKSIEFSKYYKNIQPVNYETSLAKISKLFRKYHTKYLPVVDENNILVGMVSLRDLRKHYFNRKKLKVKDIMNKKPLILHKNSGLDELIKTLGLFNASTIPYVDENGKYVSMIDLNKIYKDLALIDRYKLI
jgi:CIC family chloride channel protein